MSLLGKLFPNLKEARYSAIYGTTDDYTLSIYIEGSVVFAPEIQRGIRNYLYLCWPKARQMGKDSFNSWWEEILQSAPPLATDVITNTLGETEMLEAEYGGLPKAKQEAEKSWNWLVNKVIEKNADPVDGVGQMSFDDLSVKSSEVASALSFLNYFSNRQWLELLD